MGQLQRNVYACSGNLSLPDIRGLARKYVGTHSWTRKCISKGASINVNKIDIDSCRKENLLVNLESQRLIEDTLEKTNLVMDTQSMIQRELTETKELSEEAN